MVQSLGDSFHSACRALGSSSRNIRRSIFQRAPSTTPRASSSLKNMGVASAQEAYFVFALGLLLSINSGYINGLCLSGLLNEGGSDKQGVSAFTGTYTKSGLALAEGDPKLFGFEFTLILAFIGGATVAGIMNPKAIPHQLVPSYGPTFMLGSLCMIAASIAATKSPEARTLYYFAAAANGIQNGMTSTYSSNLIRTTHLTGTSTDIGLILGQMIRGNKKNYWKFKVLVGLASSFWLGGLISFYAATAFLSNALWFSAALYLTIGLTHITFVVLTQKVSFTQACFGTYKWQNVLENMAVSINDGTGDKSSALASLTRTQIDQVFDEIDADGSGEIDADELKLALEKMGIKLTKKNVETMIRVVDDNGDGVVDRSEFRTLVSMATLRAEHKKEKKERRRQTAAKFKQSITLNQSITSSFGAEYTGEDLLEDISERSKSSGDEEKKSGGHLREKGKLNQHVQEQQLPRTYQEALPSDGKVDDRAIIVTESKHPFKIVGVNEPWEDLCGYKSSEAIQKSMSDLIQGPKTNREGLKEAMDKLTKEGAENVEVDTVNYRKDGTMFKNHLVMGPLYDEEDGDDLEEGKREVAFFVGILNNIGELGKALSFRDEEVKEEKEDSDIFDDNPVSPVQVKKTKNLV